MNAIPALLLAGAALVAASAATAADAPYSHAARGIVAVDDAGLPGCDNPGILRRVASAFQDKESEYWNSDLTLGGFEPPDQLGLRSRGLDFIPRRFCHAYALTSDGVRRGVHYSIGKNTGTLGVVNGVDFCVSGLDRNLAYAPHCKMVGP